MQKLFSLVSILLALLACSGEPTRARPATEAKPQQIAVAYVAICPWCSGEGVVVCSTCNGKEQAPCRICKGEDQTKKPCLSCGGADLTKLPCRTCKGVDQTKLPCSLCKGKGCSLCSNSGHRSACFICNGRGLNPKCFLCNGSGRKLACLYCSGKGVDTLCRTCNGARKLVCAGCERQGEILYSRVSDGRVEIETAPRAAENGSYYGQLNDRGIPKTVYVRGYLKKDGTYVSSYYRSPPSRIYALGEGGKLSATRFESIAPSVAENGSYYGQMSDLTGLPKTVYVNGYYKSDGTYVRSHYRSHR